MKRAEASSTDSVPSGELWKRFAKAEKRAIQLYWQDQAVNSEVYRCWTAYTEALRREEAAGAQE